MNESIDDIVGSSEEVGTVTSDESTALLEISGAKVVVAKTAGSETENNDSIEETAIDALLD